MRNLYEKKIFLHIPKTAGQSLRYVTKNESGIVDLEHSTVRDQEDLFDLSDESIFRFCFVRNPFSRILSGFFHLIEVDDSAKDHENGFFRRRFELKEKYGTDFNAFVSDNRFSKLDFEHFHPISHFIVDSSGMVPFDFVGRFEQLSEDFSRLSNILGFGVSELPRFNYTGVPEYHAYKDKNMWSKSSLELVYKFYSQDFELLDYRADGSDFFR